LRSDAAGLKWPGVLIIFPSSEPCFEITLPKHSGCGRNCCVFEEPKGSGPEISKRRGKQDGKEGENEGGKRLHVPGLMLLGHLLLDVTIRQPVTNTGRDLVEGAPLDLRVRDSHRR
jgi:hypothetical protein